MMMLSRLRTVSCGCQHTSSTVIKWKYNGRIPWSVRKRWCSRYNALHIQMLSDSLHKQVFREGENKLSEADFKHVKKHLSDHNLFGIKTDQLQDVAFKLPNLQGENVNEHFSNIASDYSRPYVEQAIYLASLDLLEIPKTWVYAPGWTRYNSDGTTQSVSHPLETGVVFDIEVLMAEGNRPTMATAASTEAWYSWCSERVFAENDNYYERKHQLTPHDLIPLEPPNGDNTPRIVIGHNVGFDRTFVQEQYCQEGSRVRFLDTMSLHIASVGFTGYQRALYMARKKGNNDGPQGSWYKVSTLNNLNDVYQHHCKGEPLDKDKRNVFIVGNITDVRNQFQDLMTYCANDVLATQKVFKVLWPEFNQRFPHPVTLAGMLEMGTAYLPINSGWERYISESEAVWSDLEAELRHCLMHLANDACQLLHGERYKDDPWLWDLDWSVHKYKGKAFKIKRKKGEELSELELAEKVIEAAQTQGSKRPSHLAGYPNWYRELCPKDHEISAELPPGPSQISIRKRVAAKLLRLTWSGFPLHYQPELGWGYLVPKLDHEMNIAERYALEEAEDGASTNVYDEDDVGPVYPTKAATKMIRDRLGLDLEVKQASLDNVKLEALLAQVDRDGIDPKEHQKLWGQIQTLEQKIKKQKKKEERNANSTKSGLHKGLGPCPEVDIPGMHFFKMPHKDGPEKNVGNPLSKDFLQHIEQGVLHSQMEQADRILKLNIMCSYWKMNRERIRSQMVVEMDRDSLSKTITEDEHYDKNEFYGAILPRVVTAGTVTRRAVESTWLTASNAYLDRVGSELKAIIQSPPGYHFVGADVDSQELWIAAILGDAHFAGVHGCTAFGWMALQGKKSEGTDLHSRTAALVGISRDQAKIFNYGRIYGAGKIFAKRLLMQFNHELTTEAAAAKAKTMYLATKGTKINFRQMGDDYDEDYVIQDNWQGGSESHMFNKLESIAMTEMPRTPVLGCLISKALEPSRVNYTDFMTSRVNWVVQSSAVDYLHLMLVCMRWLCDTYDIKARFSISIHDEVRYLVRSEDRYRAALALQITNLLTRSMFAYKLGMKDLPQSVAFFSNVDIDRCLRKEVDMDCCTPSNPSGLARGYGLPPGEALDIYTLLEKTNSSLNAADQPINEQFSSQQLQQ